MLWFYSFMEKILTVIIFKNKVELIQKNKPKCYKCTDEDLKCIYSTQVKLISLLFKDVSMFCTSMGLNLTFSRLRTEQKTEL